MHCPECGHENKDSAKFCTACGASLSDAGPASADAKVAPKADPKAAAEAARRQAAEAARQAAARSRAGLTTLFYLIPKPVWGLAIVGLLGWGLWSVVLTPAGPGMVSIPGGQFRMGCVSGKDCQDDEKPVHTVTIKPFKLSRHETTFAEWDACVTAGGCKRTPDDQGWGRGERPVINVSWDDVQEYIVWLNNETGKRYRLPSEAEWEYAARAGTNTRFHTGDCLSTAQANYYGDSPASGCPKGEDRKKTLPVGSLAKNAFGLYDMHGNVWEWTQDCRNGSYSGAPTDGAAWTSGDCARRVQRGGSWSTNAWTARAANRNTNTRDSRNSNLGFRLARTR